MKYSIITEGRDHVVRLSNIEDTRFFDRIRRDAHRGLINGFRHEVTWRARPQAVSRYHLIPRICPTAVLRRQQNGALTMKTFNGLLLLDVKPLVGTEAQEEVKRRVMALPSTAAAFVGASGRSVKVLVRIAGADGHLPQTEQEAERFYAMAHDELLPVYQALVAPHPIVPDCRGVRHAFLMPLDEAPAVNPAAVPFRVGEAQQRSAGEADWKAFETYRNDFRQVLKATLEETGQDGNVVWNEDFVRTLARNLRQTGMPREEAYTQAARQYRYYERVFSRDRLHTLIDQGYDGRTEDDGDEAREQNGQGQSGDVMLGAMRTLEERYQFRHNVIMGYTEYRRRTSYYAPWRPVTDRVQNELTLELQLAGIEVWDRDVKRYLGSLHIRDYDIVEERLLGLGRKWDGHDHIRQLARTVPTRTREWPDWFHRFFLGMVAQWQHRNPRFGNAIVPLLVSRQGYHKSDFCRQLLPPDLRSWGYTDSLSPSEERPTLLAMTQMLLICLDEFNQIPVRKQEGFLKNIITLPAVKVKRPYGRHVEDLPRLASFIATTNQPDVLADPSGSRRFVGILIDGDIDTSQTPNYEQLLAQAVHELDEGERYWFDERETEAVMRHNRKFQLRSEALVLFFDYFDLPRREADGEWMTAAHILATLKQRARGLLRPVPSVNKFARELRSLPDIVMKEGHNNNFYLVRSL